jgi:hypothetical protein
VADDGSLIRNHSLHEQVFTATFTVKNNGTIDGHEVPQLYLSKPASANSPPFELRGYVLVLDHLLKSSPFMIQLLTPITDLITFPLRLVLRRR